MEIGVRKMLYCYLEQDRVENLQHNINKKTHALEIRDIWITPERQFFNFPIAQDGSFRDKNEGNTS